MNHTIRTIRAARAASFGILLLASGVPAGQALALQDARPLPKAQPTPPRPDGSARRVLIAQPLGSAAIAIDGRLDEAVWANAAAAGDFIVHEPNAGAPSAQRTEARVVYGPDAIHIGMRMYDSAPDSIVAMLARRDQIVHSDWVFVALDSYYDRRTAFVFGVNPRGVKADMMLYDDVRQNATWDAIWEVATAIDSLGWTAEFRIPLSQLRFNGETGGARVWGVQFHRRIARTQEGSFWAPLPRDANGNVSMFGDLQGLHGLQPRRNVEVLPYTVGQVTRAPGTAANPFFRSNDTGLNAGADIRYGITSNLTLNATINPDFGQVEADPSVVNLSAFETFLPEKRPFFVEGGNIFNFGIGVGDGAMGNESLFYSRRIGRRPQGSVPGSAAFHDTPAATTILGAAKLSGRTADGWSLGVLNAVTGPEHGQYVTRDGVHGRALVEPWTNYAVARVMRDFDGGTRSVGAIATATNRYLDGEMAFLRSAAYAAGLDGRQRFGDWEASGWFVGSHIRGDTSAIARAQRSAARYYQRPDATHVTFDPTRTSLSGWAASAQVHKSGGGHWRGGGIVNVRSPGFEVNDIGYQQSADRILQVLHVGYDQFRPTPRLRRWNLNMNQWAAWNFGGDPLALGANVNGSFTLPNLWGGHAGLNRELAAVDVTGLRGGPALLRNGSWNLSGGIFTDQRKDVLVRLSAGLTREDETGAMTWRASPSVTVRPSHSAEISLSPSYARAESSAQFIRRSAAGGSAVYLLGGLVQTTTSLTARVNYTVTPELSLQLYAQPFISAGSYTSFREAADPRARAFDARFRTYAPAQLTYDAQARRYGVDRDGNGTVDFSFADPDFNFKQMRSTAVVRWEYRPGSTLFLVWSHGRTAEDPFGDYRFGRDVSDLWSAAGTNTLLVKFSYWLGL
jgi:hypothetical protein